MADLHGKRVLITRPRESVDDFARVLQAAGAQPVVFPVIEIAPVEDPSELDRALSALSTYDWLVLTSVNGVRAVWARLQALGIAHLPEHLRIAAIGPQTTAALQAHEVNVFFTPGEYVAEAILPGLGELRGRRVLLPRADIARPALAEAIRLAGGEAHEIAAYRTLPAHPDPRSLEALQAGVEIITFTSSSTVRNFVHLVSRCGLDPFHLPGSPTVACIGPITAATAREEGFSVAVVAGEYTTAGLLKALLEYEREK